MNEQAKQLSLVQQIREEFMIIALTSLIATAAIWLYVSMNLLWTAVVYFGFLVFIALVYGMINYYGRDAEQSDETG